MIFVYVFISFAYYVLNELITEVKILVAPGSAQVFARTLISKSAPLITIWSAIMKILFQKCRNSIFSLWTFDSRVAGPRLHYWKFNKDASVYHP